MSTRWRPQQSVRALAIGVVRRGSEILVVAVQDDAGLTRGWRPPGGTIEFGERAADALRREMVEEIGQSVAQPAPLAVLESFYEHHGAAGHEIVFVFEATFEDDGAYARERFEFADGDVMCRAEWIDVDRFRTGELKLLPRGLLDRL
jgi:ADP-ribose pyrophosphatase YjhB (NUDIX family)